MRKWIVYLEDKHRACIDAAAAEFAGGVLTFYGEPREGGGRETHRLLPLLRGLRDAEPRRVGHGATRRWIALGRASCLDAALSRG